VDLARCGQEYEERKSANDELVGAKDARGYGQGRCCDREDINWIWSHGGGALTAFADRFLFLAVSRPPYAGKFNRAAVEGELRCFYYDTAQVANHITLSAMAQLMPISQIVYGTDFVLRPTTQRASPRSLRKPSPERIRSG
jgi:hypothetical protein